MIHSITSGLYNTAAYTLNSLKSGVSYVGKGAYSGFRHIPTHMHHSDSASVIYSGTAGLIFTYLAALPLADKIEKDFESLTAGNLAFGSSLALAGFTWRWMTGLSSSFSALAVITVAVAALALRSLKQVHKLDPHKNIATLAQFQNQKAIIEREVDTLTQHEADLQDTLKGLELRKTALELQIGILEQNQQEAQLALNNLEARKNPLESEINTLGRTKVTLEASLLDLLTKQDTFNGEIKELNQSKEAARSTLNGLEAEISELNAQISNLNHDRNTAQKALKDLEAEKAKLITEIGTLNQTKTELTAVTP